VKRSVRSRTLEDFVEAARHDLPSERELGTTLTGLIPFAESRLRAEQAAPLATPLGLKLLLGGVVALAIGAAVATARTGATGSPVRPGPHDAPVPSAAVPSRLEAFTAYGPAPRVDSPEPAFEVGSPASPKKERRSSPVKRSASPNSPQEKAEDHADVAPAPPPPPQARADAEANLIESTRRALHSDPSAALSLAAEHAREFPSGLLSVEREALAIRALVLLGRRKEAGIRLESFERVHPRSVHVSRLHAVLGDGASSSSR
jgi:hypothetical protein